MTPKGARWRQLLAPLLFAFWPYLALTLGVAAVFWKLLLTSQYTFLDNPDLAYQVLPWLEAQVVTLRHGAVLLWTPYEWFGHPLLGQVQPAVASPFTWLLALAPLREGFLQIPWLHAWFVSMHVVAAVFAYWLLRDLGSREGAAVVGGIFYATAGYCGNTEWPQQLAPGIWAPLVFLYLLRARRGVRPLPNAALAGLFLGVSWLCGHHGPSLMLSLAVAAVCVVDRAVLRSVVLFTIAALVSAVQVLPAIEYGKLAKRWTASGALTWSDKVSVKEHEDSSLKPADLPRLLLPGGNALRTDPFVGAVGLTLAALAVAAAFARVEVRLFAALAVGALLYSMGRNNALYGFFYGLVPMVEKSRAPIVAMSVFHFCVSVLVGIGADVLVRERATRFAKWLAGAGAAILAIYVLHAVSPAVPVVEDPRPQMTGLLLLLLATLMSVWQRGYLRAGVVLTLLGGLIAIEQSNEVGWNWTHYRDVREARFLKPLSDTRDAGDFLRGLPNPKRVHVNDDHIKFTFGDWYRLDSGHAFTASMLTATSELNWWQDRLIRMYAVNYEVSKQPTRAGQEEIFAGASGLKVYRNPSAFPRAWTVHEVLPAAGEVRAREMVRDGKFDLATTAVMTDTAPRLAVCPAPDRVTSMDVRAASARVNVEMACEGLLILSDNWYPGWTVAVDGKAAPMLRVNTVLRGVAVPAGAHEVRFRYRPWSVFGGLALTVLGFAAAWVLVKFPSRDASTE